MNCTEYETRSRVRDARTGKWDAWSEWRYRDRPANETKALMDSTGATGVTITHPHAKYQWRLKP